MESRRTSVVVAGAGPAGLGLSAQLVAHGVDHVVLERGRVAHAWRTQRWDSLRLLTPNWMTSLPRLTEPVGDPDGFMTGGGDRRRRPRAAAPHVPRAGRLLVDGRHRAAG